MRLAAGVHPKRQIHERFVRLILTFQIIRERCWIVADEYNQFTWPGPDIRPIRRSNEISPFYGPIPGKLFDQLRQLIERVARAGKLRGTERAE